MDPTLLDDDSGDSDEDYVPDKVAVSSDDGGSDYQDSEADSPSNSPSGKRTKKSGKRKKKRKHSPEPEITKTESPKNAEERKKIEDDIWADFKRDTGFQSAKERSQNPTNKTQKPSNSSESQKPEKSCEKEKVTEIFRFAGEEVEVEKEVLKRGATDESASSSVAVSTSKPQQGLGNILQQMRKKQKINTLEKSKLDWDRFKKEEKIEEDLQNYNKGKEGYLERKDFLERTDLRQFEKEKEIRAVERSKRINFV